MKYFIIFSILVISKINRCQNYKIIDHRWGKNKFYFKQSNSLKIREIDLIIRSECAFKEKTPEFFDSSNKKNEKERKMH